MGLVIRFKDQITAVTKVDVFGQAAGSHNLPFLTACRIVIQSSWGTNEPAGLAELLRSGEKPTEEFFQSLEGMTLELAANWLKLTANERMQYWTRWLNGTYAAPETNQFMAAVREHLNTWHVSLTPTSPAEPQGEDNERPVERTTAAASNS